MALFGFNYSKPGPGVSKDEPQKKAFFRFFGILGSKFWDLIKMNMLYFITIIIPCIPLIFTLFALFTSKNVNAEFSNVFNYLILFICALPIAFTGPFTAGFTYLLRNCVRQEHYFLWSDFKDNVKSNFKQSFFAALINTIVFIVLIFNIRFYYLGSASNQMLFIPLVLCLFITVLFLFMNYYIYMIIVTFKLNLRQMYRNAFIFSILGLGRNLLVTFLLFVLVLLHVMFLYISLIFIPFLSLSLAGLLISFSDWPMVKKFMIDPTQVETPPASEDDTLFEDRGKER